MKKLLALFTSSVFIASLLINPAFGAVKAGATCAKAGQTSTLATKKFTCIKSGKKLIWDSGVTILRPASNPTPTPTDSAVPSITPTPTSISQLETKPVSANQIDPIRIAAFNAAHSKICGNDHSKIHASIDKGPNFPAKTADFVTQILEHDFDCFNDMITTDLNLKVFYLTENDDSFVNSKVIPAIHPGDVEHMKWLMTEMKAGRWGAGGMAGGFVNRNIDNSNLVMVIHTTINHLWSDDDAKLVTHEFTHVLQHYFRDRIKLENDSSWYQNVPGYFMEGGADALAFSFEAKTPEKQDSLMKQNESDMTQGSEATAYRNVKSETEMLDFMRGIVAPKDSVTQNIQYPLGQLISEYILGQYGLEAYLNLIRGTGTYLQFSDNLKATIGLTQDQLLEAAAPYVFSQWKISVTKS
jgi:hypothetical protein